MKNVLQGSIPFFLVELFNLEFPKAIVGYRFEIRVQLIVFGIDSSLKKPVVHLRVMSERRGHIIGGSSRAVMVLRSRRAIKTGENRRCGGVLVELDAKVAY